MKIQLQLHRNKFFTKIKRRIAVKIFSILFRKINWKVDRSIYDVLDKICDEFAE